MPMGHSILFNFGIYDGVNDIDKTSNPLPNLIICHVNIVRLYKNIVKLEEFLNKFSHLPDIICVSETRTNEIHIKNINIPGYNFFIITCLLELVVLVCTSLTHLRVVNYQAFT